MQDIQEEIARIHKRNKRVEADKAWETSWTRRVFIAITTYLVMILFMWSINVEKPFLNAITPTFGYLLSTASLSILKSWWIGKRKTK